MTTTEQNAAKQKRFAQYLSTLPATQREGLLAKMPEILAEKMRRAVREVIAKRVAGWPSAMKRRWLESLRRENLHEYQLTFQLVAAFEAIEQRAAKGVA